MTDIIGYAKVNVEDVKKWVEDDKNKQLSWYNQCWNEDYDRYKSGEPGFCHILPKLVTSDVNPISKNFVDLAECIIGDGQRFGIFYIDDRYALLGYNNKKFLVPASLVIDVEMLKDYSYLTADELVSLTNSDMMNNMLPADVSEYNVKTLKQQIEEEKSKIEAEDEKYRLAVEEIREAARAKERELMSMLAAEKAKLDAVKSELENKLYVLETQIYGIRCYLGEVIDFSQIRAGEYAPEDEPVVLFQKVRFLDEEMGKYLSLFAFGEFDTDKQTFKDVLKARDDIRDLFCPSSRCIVVIRNSRSGKAVQVSSEVANIISKYEYAHGKQIAILVRDGENLYISWTDEEKINLSSEDMFLRPGVTQVDSVKEEEYGFGHTYWNEEERIKAEKKQAKTDAAERVSRYFLMSILQGMIDRGGLINIPAKTKITEESDLVKFSFAEGLLNDTTYGTFSDILAETRKPAIKQGEMLYTICRPSRDDFYQHGLHSSRYETYNNERGIGSRNRTHDACIPYRELIPINKILKSCDVTVTIKLRKPVFDKITEGWSYYGSRTVFVKPGEEVLEEITKTIHLDEDDFNKAETITNIDKVIKIKYSYGCGTEFKANDVMFKINSGDYFNARLNRAALRNSNTSPEACEAIFDGYGFPDVTVTNIEKETIYTYVSVTADSYTLSESKVNFRIYPDEYIRASYLCSTWLKYVVTTKNIGTKVSVHANLDYAQTLPYLKDLLGFRAKVESDERDLLIKAGGTEWLESNPKWDLELCKWRIANSIPYLTISSARKFLKTVKE